MYIASVFFLVFLSIHGWKDDVALKYDVEGYENSKTDKRNVQQEFNAFYSQHKDVLTQPLMSERQIQPNSVKPDDYWREIDSPVAMAPKIYKTVPKHYQASDPAKKCIYNKNFFDAVLNPYEPYEQTLSQSLFTLGLTPIDISEVCKNKWCWDCLESCKYVGKGQVSNHTELFYLRVSAAGCKFLINCPLRDCLPIEKSEPNDFIRCVNDCPVAELASQIMYQKKNWGNI